ncbi:MAG: hypothetical protein LW720_10970 [Pirellula sp.]|nr:hypothetical protein [Pirellula sp.]
MNIPELKVEHHARRGIRSSRIFLELRPILDEAFEIFGDKSQYVVAAPQYRAAANTAMGWKNLNLRTEIKKLGDSPRVCMRTLLVSFPGTVPAESQGTVPGYVRVFCE